MEEIYYKYSYLQKPPIIFSNENTKNIFPLISTDFNEENIYLEQHETLQTNTGIKINNNIQIYVLTEQVK